jgi:chemotaxis protein MotB
MARRYKKVDGGHGHHGGAWKVAYADFVTAMMALFMVMWLLASTDAKSRKEISNYFRSGILPEGDMSMNHASQVRPAVIEETSAPPPNDNSQRSLDANAAAKQISDKLGKLAALDAELASVIQHMHVKVTPEGVLIDMVDADEGLLFDLSSAKLTEPMARFIRALAPVIVGLERKVEINGHTDARPFATGSKVSNWDLSYQRANAAREILEGSGVTSATIDGVFARGSAQLFVPDDPYSARNRRLSFLVKIAKTADTAEVSDLK